jgi:hypothetical protein
MKHEARENFTVRSFVICIILQTLFRYEDDKVGGVCSTHGRENECILNFGRNF